MATFLAYGSDILENPNVSSNSSAGNNGAGEITLTASGSDFSSDQIFADDYIVEFEIPDAYVNADGELTGSGGITGIVVYASAADYTNGIALYTYEPQNSGQEATIQNSVDGIGDTYLRFNANVLVSSDAGAPTLNTLFVSPGSDVANGSSPAVFDHDTDVDYNHDGSIEPGTIEVGNGLFNIEDSVSVCYSEGTMISCANGARAVEDLQEGDLVQTLDHGLQPVIWNGRTSYSLLDLLSNAKRLPVVIGPKASGASSDLRVTRQHRMLDARGFFVKAADIAKLPHSGLRIARGVRAVAYHHILLPQHEVIYANGLASESLYPGPEAMKSMGRLERVEILKHVPKLSSNSVEEAYGPMVRPVAKYRDLADEWQPVLSNESGVLASEKQVAE